MTPEFHEVGCPNCGQWHPANVIQCGLVSWTPQRQTRSVP